MNVLVLLAWILLAPCGVGLVVWIVAGARYLRLARLDPTVRAGLDLAAPAEGWPSVSIIVPAHDEERVIGACARSLRAIRYDPLEIIFVLDRCADGTRAALAPHADDDARITLIDNDRCPDDWAGKCNAARIGADRATGDLLLFTDADTVFDADLVRAAAALLRRRELGLLSLLSTLTYTHPWERRVQPVASLHLVRLYPIERVNRADAPRPFANGQFMLFDRAWYEKIGGHEAVKDDLLEDIAFARRLHRCGGRGGVLIADGMLTCSMYDTLDALRTGWQRIFVEACKRKPARLRKNAWVVLAAGVGLPLARIAAIAVGVALMTGPAVALGAALAAVAAAGWALETVVLARTYAMSGAPLRAVASYPLGSWVLARILFRAARDLAAGRPITWGGRTYVLEPRGQRG